MNKKVGTRGGEVIRVDKRKLSFMRKRIEGPSSTSKKIWLESPVKDY